MAEAAETLTTKQAQAFGRRMQRYQLWATPEETEEFMATDEGRRMAELIQKYKARMGYKF